MLAGALPQVKLLCTVGRLLFSRLAEGRVCRPLHRVVGRGRDREKGQVTSCPLGVSPRTLWPQRRLAWTLAAERT